MPYEKRRQEGFKAMIDSEGVRTERNGLELIYDVILWQKATILKWTILTTSLALVWLLLQPTRYTATTQLLLDTKRYQPVMDAQANATIDSSYVETQLSTFKSDTIAIAVLDSLRLWEDPEFTGGRSLVTRITALFAAGISGNTATGCTGKFQASAFRAPKRPQLHR